VQAQYFAGVVAVDETRWLADINFLAQLAVQKRHLHIHVVNLPLELSGDGEQQPDGIESSDRSKDFVEVNPRPLNETLGDEPGLVLEDVASGVTLEFLHPFEADWLVASWEIRQRPRLVPLDRIQLCSHRPTPCFLSLSFNKSGGLAGGHEKEALCSAWIRRI
jgi:hypothetical protein